MDTKSTSIKLILTKALAVVLCLVITGFGAKHLFEDFVYMREKDMGEAIYLQNILVFDSQDAYQSPYMQRQLQDYMAELFRFAHSYGDGSESAFKRLNEENTYKFEYYKRNFLSNIYDGLNGAEVSRSNEIFCVYLAGYFSLEKTGGSKSGAAENVYVYDEDALWHVANLSNRDEENYLREVFTLRCKEAKLHGGDVMLSLPEMTIISENEREALEGGEYVLKVNEELFKQALISQGYMGFCGSYEEYNRQIKEHPFHSSYKNISYAISLSGGETVTNIPDYGKAVQPAYPYRVLISGSGKIFETNIGYCIKTNAFYDDFSHNYYFSFYRSDKVSLSSEAVTVATTGSPTLPYTEQTTMHYDYLPTAVVTAPPKIGQNNKTQELIIYFGDDAEFNGETLESITAMIIETGAFARSAAGSVILWLAVCFIIFVLLAALVGRKSLKDKNVYCLATDKIFLEIRLALGAGIIFCLGGLAVWLIDEYEYFSVNASSLVPTAIGLIGVLCAAVLLDFSLYLIRMLKAKKLKESILIVVILRLVIKTVFYPLKKLTDLIFLKGAAFEYTRELEKTVKKRTLILILFNLFSVFVVGFLIIIWGGLDNFGELLVLMAVVTPAIIWDVASVIKGLRFVGGTDKLIRVIGQYRQGNLDVRLNRAAVPSYLLGAVDDLEGLGDGLKVAVSEAVKQEMTKTELITNISHDLKTPLTSIINYVELLKQCDIQNETALSYLEVLGEKSDRLKFLITDLVEASKAATGNIEVNMVDVSLNEIISQLLGEYNDIFTERRLEIICEMPSETVMVRADSKLLYRVFDNLFVNIKKYALEGTRVYISVAEDKSEGVVTIKNISAAPLNISPRQLKQRFVRGDSSRTTEGNGLGLSIAENLCILQKGRLDIDITGDLFIAVVTLRKSE